MESNWRPACSKSLRQSVIAETSPSEVTPGLITLQPERSGSPLAIALPRKRLSFTPSPDRRFRPGRSAPLSYQPNYTPEYEVHTKACTACSRIGRRDVRLREYPGPDGAGSGGHRNHDHNDGHNDSGGCAGRPGCHAVAVEVQDADSSHLCLNHTGRQPTQRQSARHRHFRDRGHFAVPHGYRGDRQHFAPPKPRRH